jgi:hypothetical protein
MLSAEFHPRSATAKDVTLISVIPKLASLFEDVYRELRPGTAVPECKIQFYAFASLNNTIRLREGRILIRLSDLLEGAEDSVLHAILHILVSKLYRKEINAGHSARFRRFAGGAAIAEKLHLVRSTRGRKQILGPAGTHYHLDEIFDELNVRFFHGLMARPRMSWSANHSRYRLGHYDPAHNTIVVSRVFDRPGVPRYAIEYLVYHEMLHLRHPVRMQGSRRCVHPRAFQEEEEWFPQLAEAKKYLKEMK